MKRAYRGMVLLSILVAVMGQLSPARADFDSPPTAGSSHASSGYILTLHAIAKVAGDDSDDSGAGIAYIYDFSPACTGNNPGDGDVLCPRALKACKRQDPTALLYFVFRGIDLASLESVGEACLGDADFVDRAQLNRDVIAQLMRRLPLRAPEVHTAPPRVTLVRLPTVVWSVNPSTGAPDDPRYSVSATVDDVSVTLTVEGRWQWDLADGTGSGAAGPGVAYVSGKTPDPRAAPGYYTASGAGTVTSFATRGTRRLAVTVTWVPSYTVDYEIGTTELDNAAVSYTSAAQLRVGEARAVLVAGGGSR